MHGKRERIELTSKYFSKKLLYALYEGAFAPNKYNRYDGVSNDYQFVLDMFNKEIRVRLQNSSIEDKKRFDSIFTIKPFKEND